MIDVATGIATILKQEGIEWVSTFPVCSVNNALGKAEIPLVMMRDDRYAIALGDAFSRVTSGNNIGVCTVQGGVNAAGLQVAYAGLAQAYEDGSPVLCITDGVPIGKTENSHFDITSSLKSVSKWYGYIDTPDRTHEFMRRAFTMLRNGPPGPVILAIPDSKALYDELVDPYYPVKSWKYGPNPDDVSRAIDLLLSASAPMLYVGEGILYANATDSLLKFAEKCNLPVATTLKAKGAFPENHPLSLGPIGMHGHAEANKMMAEADCVLAIGTRFSDRSVGTFEAFEKRLKIIHMDVDPAEIGKNQTTSVAVVGDVRASLRIMVKLLLQRSVKKTEDSVWIKHVRETKDYWKENLKLHPGEMGAAKILRKLRELLPKESVVTTEVGQHQMWASLFYDVIQPGTFFSSTGLGTMGWGFPASIGAKVARPDVPVVDIAGDGSFSMTENSLATAVLEDIPVIVFILNNSTLGMVAQWQRTFYDRRMIGVDQGGCPDYVKLAESYGAQGIRAQSMDELDKAIKSALSSDVATVIDIPIDPEEDVLPFVAPGTSLSDMILPS